MIYKLVLWMLAFLSVGQKKALMLEVLGDLVDGRESSIDKQTAEAILQKVIKSAGNEITAFVVRK